VTGILLWPVIWFGLALAAHALFRSLGSLVPAWLLVSAGVAAAFAAGFIVRRSTVPVAVTFSVLALFALRFILAVILQIADDLPGVE
jgi:hypothetical protein